MATPDLLAVGALRNKAYDLLRCGHRARSLEYFKRALAMAEAHGAEDCLIVAATKVEQARSIMNTAMMQDVPPSSQLLGPMIPLTMTALATVQRRRAAGTLLPGACRADEVASQRIMLESIATSEEPDVGTASVAAALAPLVGYMVFMETANSAQRLLMLANRGVFLVSKQQKRACVVILADAAELYLLPRPHEEFGMSEEASFADIMLSLMSHPEFYAQHGADSARLRDNILRVMQSDVLQHRDAGQTMRQSNQVYSASRSAAAAAAAAPGLRTCGLETCGAREQHPSHFKSCSACRGMAYCCKEHQTEHWPAHKAACKAARKGKAAATEE